VPEYVLTSGAEDDLDKIVEYTMIRWGAGQAQRDGSKLKTHFKSLADDRARNRAVFDGWPELQMSRCEHHYVFSIRNSAAPWRSSQFSTNRWIFPRDYARDSKKSAGKARATER